MELECGYSPQDKTIAILSFLAPPHSGLGQGCCWKIYPGKSTAVRRSCFLPHSTDIDYKLLHTHTHTHIYMHSPPLPRSLASVALNRQPDKRVYGQRREWTAGPDGCLLELYYFPCCKVVCLWFMCFLLLRCFSCSHTVLPKEHSLGVIFFLLTFLMLCCIFLQFPVFLSCLPPCHICMLCMYGQVDG